MSQFRESAVPIVPLEVEKTDEHKEDTLKLNSNSTHELNDIRLYLSIRFHLNCARLKLLLLSKKQNKNNRNKNEIQRTFRNVAK